jgi:hypothetical protein
MLGAVADGDLGLRELDAARAAEVRAIALRSAAVPSAGV